MTVTKGKDNIPSWDGNPSTWVEYRQAAFMYEETVKWENRYLCGPRLAAELSGAARVVLANKKRGWLSTQDGVAKLLRCLREAMSEPALPEIANQLRLYFKVLKRRRGEPMAAFCARHREEYAKACKALTRVMKERKNASQPEAEVWRSSRRQSWNTDTSWWRSPSARSSARGGTSDLASEAPRETEEQDGQEEAPGGNEEAAWWDEAGWYDDAWWWYGTDYYQEDDGENSLLEDDEEDYIEILPDPIKGWLLLEKSNIDHLERSLIQTEVKNDFSLASVEQALRNHFTDDQIRRRDGEAKHGAFFGEDEDDEESWWQEEDESFFEEMSEEDVALYQSAKSEEYEAWMQIQQGKQTLREARARQHEVRMGRKFYDYTGKKGDRGKGKGKQFGWSSGKGKGYSKDNGKPKYGPCARCGKGHDTQFCPANKESENKTFEAEEQSEFIYGNFEVTPGEDAFCWTNLETSTWSTQQVVTEGYGVLDGGATKTMASVRALEHLQRHSRDQQQVGITKVDVEERPTFGFGNSEHNQCVSTCYLKLPVEEQDMSFKIHALDKGAAPVLISVSTLRRMGAIIDYTNDEAIFTKVNAQKIIKLSRSAAGHQLLPLTSDFMRDGVVFSKATTSLRQLVLE